MHSVSIVQNPASKTLSNLDAKIGDLASKLEVCGPDDIALAINGLMNGGKVFPTSIQAESPLEEYRMALCGLSREALRKVYSKLKRGEYRDFNTDFLPIPARMAELVRSEQRILVDDIARLRQTREAIAFTEQRRAEGAVKDEGTKARIRAMLAEFRRAHEEQKAIERGQPVEVPITPERAAELEKMMALPDAPEVNAEHLQYRRSVMNKIEAATNKGA